MDCLRSLGHCDREFESIWKHGCLWVDLFRVCDVLCVGSGLATGWSPAQGVLSTIYRIMKLKMRPRPTEDCRAIIIITFQRCYSGPWILHGELVSLTQLKVWKSAVLKYKYLVGRSDELVSKHLLEKRLKTWKNCLNCVRTSAASAGSPEGVHLLPWWRDSRKVLRAFFGRTLYS
jgi:hypothetical protein